MPILNFNFCNFKLCKVSICNIKSVRVFKVTILFFGILSQFSCTTRNSQANINQLESNDRFRPLPDRFYLAYMQTQKNIGDGPEKVGEEFLFGVGCKAENKDNQYLVDVPKSSHRHENGTQRLPLNKRTMLHQFEEDTSTNKKMKPGTCRVLFGDPNVRQAISNKPENFATGDKNGVVMQTMYTVSTCAGAAFSWGSLISAIGATGLSGGTAGGGVGLPMLSWWAGSGTVFCGLNLKFLYQKVEGFKEQENKALFYKSMYNAELYTDGTLFGLPVVEILSHRNRVKKTLLGKPTEPLHATLQCTSKAHADCERYLQYIKEEKWQNAAAIYNKLFVSQFNEKVNAKFEQGWPIDPAGDRFFKAVQHVQLEYSRASGKNFEAFPGYDSKDVDTSKEDIFNTESESANDSKNKPVVYKGDVPGLQE